MNPVASRNVKFISHSDQGFADLISRVTDAVLEEVREWQNGPLDALYPVIFFDALRVKIRDEGLVRTRPFTLPSPSTATARRRCWGCGSRGRRQILAQGDERAEE